MNQYLNESGNNEWYTPPYIVNAARNALGGVIEFDPFSCELANRTVKARHYFTKEDDALTKEWALHRSVFVNPPYQRSLIYDCIAKCVEYYTQYPSTTMCILVNVSSETKWFQMLLHTSTVVCLFTRRIRFIDSMGNQSKGNTRSQAMFFYAPLPFQSTRFAEEFNKMGILMKRFVINRSMR